jgi:hypothetical protein
MSKGARLVAAGIVSILTILGVSYYKSVPKMKKEKEDVKK